MAWDEPPSIHNGRKNNRDYVFAGISFGSRPNSKVKYVLILIAGIRHPELSRINQSLSARALTLRSEKKIFNFKFNFSFISLSDILSCP